MADRGKRPKSIPRLFQERVRSVGSWVTDLSKRPKRTPHLSQDGIGSVGSVFPSPTGDATLSATQMSTASSLTPQTAEQSAGVHSPRGIYPVAVCPVHVDIFVHGFFRGIIYSMTRPRSQPWYERSYPYDSPLRWGLVWRDHLTRWLFGNRCYPPFWWSKVPRPLRAFDFRSEMPQTAAVGCTNRKSGIVKRVSFIFQLITETKMDCRPWKIWLIVWTAVNPISLRVGTGMSTPKMSMSQIFNIPKR